VAVIQPKFKFGVDVDNKYEEISTEVNALKNSELPKNIYLIKRKDLFFGCKDPAGGTGFR